MILILCSGGVDSTTIAHLAIRDGHDIHLLGVAYGQPAAPQEYAAVERLSRTLGVSRTWVNLPEIYTGRMGDAPGAPGARVVPARNLLLLALATNHAAALGASEVWYGAQGGDEAEYPDCRPGFVVAVGEIIQATEGIAVRAPLLNMSKLAVGNLARDLGVNLDLCWSCYAPRAGVPCGSCASCVSNTSARAGYSLVAS